MELSFSGNLASLRKSKGLSQRTVAADLNISQALLSHYENGAREPGLNFLSRACDYYGVTADYMLGRTELPNNNDSGFSGDTSCAWSCVSAALRDIDDPRLSLCADRYLTAALLSMLVELTENKDPGWPSAAKADFALRQAELSRLIHRITISGKAELSPAGLEGQRLLSEASQRINDITDEV